MYRGQCLNLKKNTAMVEWALHIAATLEISLLFPHEVFLLKAVANSVKNLDFLRLALLRRYVKSCFILEMRKDCADRRVHTHVVICRCVHLCVCVYEWLCLCTYLYYVYICVCVYICSMCVYLYIHTMCGYICVYTHIYTYMFVWNCADNNVQF